MLLVLLPSSSPMEEGGGRLRACSTEEVSPRDKRFSEEEQW